MRVALMGVLALVGWVAWPAALSCGWAWFVVPLGAPAIGWGHAYGLGLLASMVVGLGPAVDAAKASTKRKQKPTEAEKEAESLAGAAGHAAFVLWMWGVMALVHWLPIWWVS